MDLQSIRHDQNGMLGSWCFSIIAILIIAFIPVPSTRCWAHDIPNERVDRSIQVIVGPASLEIRYEVSLSELTLTRDLRRLVGRIEGGTLAEWFERYGRELEPLNARGFLVTWDGRELDVKAQGMSWVVEEHPLYTFTYRVDLPEESDDGPTAVSNALVVEDRNYRSSEGTSRLAIRARDGVDLVGNDLPENVESITTRPTWMLSDEEETRTRRVVVECRRPRSIDRRSTDSSSGQPSNKQTIDQMEDESRSTIAEGSTSAALRIKPTSPSNRSLGDTPFTRLLDGQLDSGSGFLLLIAAVILGALHALQPGHGKGVIAAASLADRPGVSSMRALSLAVVTTGVHAGIVLAIALILWYFNPESHERVGLFVLQGAGLVIAAVGAWKIGRILGGHESTSLEPSFHSEQRSMNRSPRSTSFWITAISAGAIPCWDAIALLMVAEALGRLLDGVVLVVAFSSGMGAVLAMITRVSQIVGKVGWARRSIRGLHLLAAGFLLLLGLAMLIGLPD